MPTDNQLKVQWQQRLQSWRKSGLNQTQWCKQNNIKPNQFCYWKQKLAGTSTSQKNDKSVSGFVPVALAPEPQTRQVEPTPFSISLPNGVRISDIDRSNLALVSQLIGMLQ